MHDALLKLDRRIEGDVRCDALSRTVYSIDASIYQIEPVGVVLPKSREDIEAAIAFARDHRLSITPRGAATGTTGGCIGPGLIIDTSKYLNSILNIDFDSEIAVCEPGVVQDQLNAALAPRGYRLGADTSTGNRATLGGMVGNNSSGAHSMRYGKMVDDLVVAELLTADGDRMRCAAVDFAEKLRSPQCSDSERRVYQTISHIRSQLADEIAARFPKIQRRVSGYNLDEMVRPGPVNLSKLIAGSEGTLGVTTELTVRISRKPAATGVCVLHFDNLIDGLKTVEFILEFKPYAVELIDDQVIALGREHPVTRGQLNWLEGAPGGLLAVEFDGETTTELGERLEAFRVASEKANSAYAQVVLTDPTEIKKVWNLRKSGLGLIMSRRSNDRAIAFLEDVAVPPERIAEFMSDFRDYIHGAGKEAGFYGHAGVGCIHVRPMLDLRSDGDVELMVRMMEDVSDMVLDYGGAVSGEHGDGLVRSWLNEKLFGAAIYEAFTAVKSAFDPDNRMNPGKIVDGQRPDKGLRIGPRTRSVNVSTFLNWDADGGLMFAADMCNGNAECRKPASGTMCPSFQASGDERDTTRARAQALAAVLHGDMDPAGLTAQGLTEVLDLCLECKGCKRECPSQVDMARMKSEVLYHYHQKNGYPLRSRVFGAVDRISRLGCMLSPLANTMMRSAPGRGLMSLIGIAPQRLAPYFARERFSTWLRRHPPAAPAGDADKVVLFVDTFTEFNYPEIGRAAVEILQALACQIVVAPLQCCGRPALSKGLLPQARARAERLISSLVPYVDNGYRIVGLEPSCILTVKDDYVSLHPGEAAKGLSRACLTIDEYVDERIRNRNFALPLRHRPANVRLHGHCHQKAVVGTTPTLNALRAVPGFDVSEFDSGCCGMAGSFGYESEHYEFSRAVGETRLFPAIRETDPDTILVANGVSCRNQISHFLGRDAKHMIQVLAASLEGNR